MIVVADEVREAAAVVALETTLVAHGFPAGEGVAVGLEPSAAFARQALCRRRSACSTARSGSGSPRTSSTRFDSSARKIGPRDLAACVVQGAVGATTVGGTLAVCRAAGIRFMGTGGLGGVHRGFPAPPDVSADLGELARTKALVVSAGIKSLLDVPATLELLESLGVPVVGLPHGHVAVVLYGARWAGRSCASRVRRTRLRESPGALGSGRRRDPARAPT